MFFKITWSIVLFYSFVQATADTYEGYKIYDILAKNANEKEVLNQLAKTNRYDFFSLPKSLSEAARVMVEPKEEINFEKALNNSNIHFTVIEENVGRTIGKQRIPIPRGRSSFQKAAPRNRFARFQRYNEINAYLDSLAESYPNRVFVDSLGRSYEGRELKSITITNGDGNCDKKVILMDAGIHAREWIAPAEALYVIYQLVENFNENSQLLKEYDWIILPVVNPDGYEYTHTNSRMWRKTRKPISRSCFGTDGNRNFDFHWGEVGASSYPCANTYKGTKAFSEPETQILRDLMLSLTGRAKMYLTLHSYGNYLLYPWGYTSNLPSTWRDLDEVAQAGAAAIRSATGNQYRVGSSTNVLHAAAGGSDDFALAVAKIPISITMELPGGGTGFDPSPQLIRPIVAETWIGIKAMAEKVISKY